MTEEYSNKEWAKSQFIQNHVRKDVGDAVLKLLAAWEKTSVPEELYEDTLDIFAHLAKGHSITPENPEELWVQGQLGGFMVGDVVRVRDDAYTGTSGRVHNGRRGVVVAMRSGDIIVRSTDERKPVLDGTHYRPDDLEKRIRPR